MATNTYVALDKQTVTSSTPSVTFTAIPSTYTDLVLEFTGTMTSSARIDIRVGNGSLDTGSNYSNVEVLGNGTSAVSYRYTNTSTMQGAYDSFGTGTGQISATFHFLNYANTTTFKTVLGRGDAASTGSGAFAGLWRSTSAINTISLIPTSNFATGTFSLYGIAAEAISPAPKATGGAIYDDDLYYYHAFGSTGVFTPNQSISADILVVAGGGAGGGSQGGGGGAGGLLGFASQSLTATNYTVTIGAGGTGVSASYNGVPGNNGSNSTFQGLTAAVGGGGGGTAGNSSVGVGSGGSGGGRANPSGAGTGTTGQGNAGGSTGTAGAKGGGGASAVGGLGLAGGAAGGTGATFNSTVGGTAGPYSFINAMGAATGTGEFSGGNYYYAGGGAGGCDVEPGGLGGGGLSTIAGRANSGGGGGGACGNPGAGGNGGSGVIIVRYLKA